MTQYQLTASNQTITGDSGADTFFAFAKHSHLGASDDVVSSTLNNGDVLDGGAGYDTLVVDIYEVQTYNSSNSKYDVVYNNDNFGATVTNIEKLVLTGGSYYDPEFDNNAPPAINLAKIKGSQEVWVQASSTYGQTDKFDEFSGLTLSGISSQSIGIDGTYSDPTTFYGSNATLNYLSAAKTATLDVRDGAFLNAQTQGLNLTTLKITSGGDGTSLVDVFKGDGTGYAKLTNLSIGASADAHLVWFGGFFVDFLNIISNIAGFDSDPTPARGSRH